MAPLQFLFTSAFVLSAVVAAPINTNLAGFHEAIASTPSRHQSEPMRMAGPVMAGVPMMGMDTQAMKSSAAAMAIQTPASTKGQQNDGVFGILNKLPLKREEERRQVNELTQFLTGINSVAKRDEEIEKRQLGLIKSIPEAVGQAAQVEKLVATLPIKRDTHQAETRPETYTEKSLKGVKGWMHHGAKNEKFTPEIPTTAGLGDIAKRTDPVGSLLTSVLAKRDTEAVDSREATYTDKALKGFGGWLHHGSKNEQETPKVPSAEETLGHGDIAKRTDPIGSLLTSVLAKRDTEKLQPEDFIDETGGQTHKDAKDKTYTEKALKGFQGWMHQGSKKPAKEALRSPKLGPSGPLKRSGPTDDLTGLLGILAKRDEMESQGDEHEKREIDEAIASASDALTSLAKRNGLDSIDALIKELTAGGQLNNGLNVRQLDIVSSVATGALQSAGAAAGQLGKLATSKHRRGNGDAGSIVTAATAAMNIGNHHKAAKEDDDTTADIDEIAADVAEGEKTLQDAASTQSQAGAHLNKRQVPPIAGSDALSIVKGLVANPKTVLTPVTKGVLIGGTTLADMAPQ